MPKIDMNTHAARWLNNPTPRKILARQFASVRHDPDVSRAGLDALGLSDIDPAHVQILDSVKYIAEMQRVGAAYAAAHCGINHLRGFV